MAWDCSSQGSTWSWNTLIAKAMRDSSVDPYTPYTTGGAVIGVRDIAWCTTPSAGEAYIRDLKATTDWTLVGSMGFKFNSALAVTVDGSGSNATNVFRVKCKDSGGTPRIIGTSSAYALIGQGGVGDFGLDSTTNPTKLDLSFFFNSTALPASVKANASFFKMVRNAALRLSNTSSVSSWQWIKPATDALVVNIRDGVFASQDPDVARADNILATYSLYSGDFSTPDAYGKFYLSNAKTVAASATGTATYAEIIGATCAGGETKASLLVQLQTTPSADNYVTIGTTTVVNGVNLQLIDLGFKFAMGT